MGFSRYEWVKFLDFSGGLKYAVSALTVHFLAWEYQDKRPLANLKNNTVDCVFQFYFTPHNYEQFLLFMNTGAPPLSE